MYEIAPETGAISYKCLPPPNFYVFSYKKWTLDWTFFPKSLKINVLKNHSNLGLDGSIYFINPDRDISTHPKKIFLLRIIICGTKMCEVGQKIIRLYKYNHQT